MKKIAHRLVTLISRIPLMLSVCKQVYRRGGYATFTTANITYGARLESKRILITGGSSGIGLSIAKKCISEGARVIVTGRDSARLNKAAAEIDSPLLKALEWDISKTELVRTKLKQACEMLGGDIDILVNNAGVLSKSQFPEVTEQVWDHVYSINSRGLFFLTQAVCKRWMAGSGGKKIINISSQGGFVGATYPYRMTKWDVAGFTQGLGVKMAPHGIIVNGIAPGIIATDMQQKFLQQGENIFCDLNPLGRFAHPGEIAELAVFLMCDASNFIVGQTIVCDGGFSIK